MKRTNKILAQNKKALFNYEILEKFQAGIVLNGQEVKSIKLGRMQIAGSFVVLKRNEVFLIGANVPAYQPKNAPADYNPQRNRKLLLKKQEIKHILGKKTQKNLTLTPLKVYTKNGKIKIEFALARGKRKADKREVIKKREAKKEIARQLLAKNNKLFLAEHKTL